MARREFLPKSELIGGITTFISAAYIIIVNPAILSQTGMSFAGVLTATVLVSAFSSIAMGLYANNPILLAPGMGLNAFFTYTICLGMNVPWTTALGAVFWSGIIFLILSLLKIRSKILTAIPHSLRNATACGIGLFIALIGLKNGGLIIASNATIITSAKLSASVITFVIGILITSALLAKNIKGALLIGIIVTTILAIPLGRVYGAHELVKYSGIYAAPDFSTFFKIDFLGSLKLSFLPVIFSLFFTDLFDSLSTFVGVAEAGDLKDSDGNPRNLEKSLLVDALATTASGIFGTSSATSYIESATGIYAGGKTGKTAIVAGLLFLPFMFLSPLISIIPQIATAPILFLVGVFMMSPINKIDWKNFEEAIPAFFTMIMIPLSFSITHGIIWGFLSYTLIKILTGKVKTLPIMLYIISLFSVLALIV